MPHFTKYHCKHVLRTFSATIKPSSVVSSPVPKARNIQESIKKQTQVSITLATYLFKNSPNGNIVFSPLSIQVGLGLIAAGCKGETQDQVLSFLQTTSIHDVNALYSELVSSIMADGSPFGGPRLSLPNGLWVEQTVSLKDSFKQIVDKIYKAKSEQVDFLNEATEVTKIVNAWAKDQTDGLIKEILSPDAVNRDTRLIFANAVYFKGVWNEKFDPSKTKDYKFHLGDGSK
nr:serpin-ZX-like [Tanacetum cinerariifolium]